jgi:hypothetical protein
MENAKPTSEAATAPSALLRSRDAFLRALPELLANPKYDRWCVAYCGDERIGIAESEIELIRECERRGLDPDQYFIGCIFPHGEDDEEVEFGLHEFDDVEDDDDAQSGNSLIP